jgi:catechol 2,3-dioxygenase-like lactoylglutathione lyase family enzyme
MRANEPRNTVATTECIIPILRVRNLAASLKFYTDSLGFQLDWAYPNPGVAKDASVSRHGHSIMLTEGVQGQFGTWVWIGVDDVDKLYADLQAKRVKILLRPTIILGHAKCA